MSTRVPSRAPTILRVASIPSMTGIRLSMTATSGRRRRAPATASSPSPASPTTAQLRLGLEDLAQPNPHEALVVRDQTGGRIGSRT
jgi:hypothetical protein